MQTSAKHSANALQGWKEMKLSALLEDETGHPGPFSGKFGPARFPSGEFLNIVFQSLWPAGATSDWKIPGDVSPMSLSPGIAGSPGYPTKVSPTRTGARFESSGFLKGLRIKTHLG